MKSKITFEELQFLVTEGFVPKIETVNDEFTNVIDTVTKSSPGKHIIYEDGSETKGHIHHKVLTNSNWDSWKNLEDLNVGDSLISNDLSCHDKTIKTIKDLPNQNWIDFTVEQKNSAYVQNGIVHHNSGKSAVIHYLMQILKFSGESKKTIVIVPNISLVEQLFSNIRDDYGFTDIEDQAYMLYNNTSKKDKDSIGNPKGMDRPFLITTWQSIQRRGEGFFEQFDAVIIDEVHGVSFSGKALKSILGKCSKAQYKIGLTGSLSDIKEDKQATIGYVGPVVYTLKSKELIDRGFLTDIKIKQMIIRYNDSVTEGGQAKPFATEVAYVEQIPERNKLIDKIINEETSEGDNILILAKHIKHMDVLEEYCTANFPNYKIHKVNGGTKGTTREAIRTEVKQSDNMLFELEFDDITLKLKQGTEVPLIDGTVKLVEDLKPEDEIEDVFITTH